MHEDVEMYRDIIFERIEQEGGLKSNDYLYPYFEQWKTIKSEQK